MTIKQAVHKLAKNATHNLALAMDRIFKLTVVCLLAGILGMLVAVYLRIPNSAPTLADLQKVDAETRQNLLMHRPLVFVEGTVDIGNTPLEVTGGYTPLEVEIVR